LNILGININVAFYWIYYFIKLIIIKNVYNLKTTVQTAKHFIMECINLMTLLVQCVIAVFLFNIILSVASLDDSNLIVFHHTTLSDCELKCAQRPWCTGVGYARTMSLCYLLHTEQDLADAGTKFQSKLTLVRKEAFRNAKASQVCSLLVWWEYKTN